MPFSFRYSQREPPSPGSTSNSPFKQSMVLCEMCTRLRGRAGCRKAGACPLHGGHGGHQMVSPAWDAHPGMPPASILLATVTSVDQTSYCQRFWPKTPPSTVPLCTPTRMSTAVLVFSRT